MGRLIATFALSNTNRCLHLGEDRISHIVTGHAVFMETIDGARKTRKEKPNEKTDININRLLINTDS